MPDTWLHVLILAFVIIAAAVAVKVTRRLTKPPDPEEMYWRFIPNWTADRVRKLHVIDPEMPELARKAAETLLHEARREGRRS